MRRAAMVAIEIARSCNAGIVSYEVVELGRGGLRRTMMNVHGMEKCSSPVSR